MAENKTGELSGATQSGEPKVKQNVKDSVFVKLFGEKKYLLQLYKELHPEDIDVTEKDIKTQSLQTTFVNTLYNDLGFTVEKNGVSRFVILVEAQSVWNNNMTMRIFIYLGATYYQYLNDKNIELTEKKKVTLPAPELYLVYTGDDRKNVPDTLELRNQMFEGKGMVDMTVKVIHSPGDTIIGQYIAFCKVFNEQVKLYGNKEKAIEETIRICLEKGILEEFILKHRQEVMSMLATFFNEESQRDLHDRAKLQEGIEIGEKKGRTDGILSTLADLVKKGLLSLSAAANQANMTETEFENIPQMKNA